ncbi:hypothetical protein DFQ29_007882, partial [Apophysomyces sp. BC1021]
PVTTTARLNRSLGRETHRKIDRIGRASWIGRTSRIGGVSNRESLPTWRRLALKRVECHC